MFVRDYEMALNVVRIWLKSDDFVLCYVRQLISTYELDPSFFDALVNLNAVEAHYNQPEVFKKGAALKTLSAKDIISAIQTNLLKSKLPMEEQIKQWLIDLFKPVIFEAVCEAMKNVKTETKHTMDLPTQKPELFPPVVADDTGYLDKKQAAQFLGIGEGALLSYVYLGKIPSKKMGNRLHFLKSDLIAYKASLKRKPKNR